MENLVLVGAGASTGAETDSGKIIPEQPPLGSQLFDRLSSKYPDTWGALPADIQDEFVDDFERGMVALGEEHSELHASLYRVMGDYFASFRIAASPTWYGRLASELEGSISNNKTVFASLNYECLLELALRRRGFEVAHCLSQRSDSAVVLKPHGSCNFLSDKVRAEGITFDEGVRFGGDIQVVGLDEARQYCQGDAALYPAMSLFRPDKYIQIGVHVVDKFQEMWKEAVDEAEKIAVIGVKPRESDEHIWGELSNTDADIYYIGGEEPFRTWENAHRADSHDEFVSSRFHSGYQDLVDKLH